MRPLVAYCHFGLGRIYRGADQVNAQRHVATAVTLYRKMRMGSWLEKAEVELGPPRMATRVTETSG